MESDGLKALIRAKALEHGFELCHFTRPDVPELHQKGYQAWVAAEMHGEMGWMAEESRVERRQQPDSMLDDVQPLLPWACAIRRLPIRWKRLNLNRAGGNTGTQYLFLHFLAASFLDLQIAAKQPGNATHKSFIAQWSPGMRSMGSDSIDLI